MKKMLIFVLMLALMTPVFALAEGEAEQAYSLTTGLPTDHPYKAMAVLFDNSADARPQKNMSQADIIYEIEIADGGHTRYLAIYNDEIPEEVEAVRSARIMHADVSLDWCATLVHFGGQKLAGSSVYDYFKTIELNRFDGLSDSKNFYRDFTRVAPYNVVGQLRQMYDSVDVQDEKLIHTPLKFSADEPTVKGKNSTVFRIPYGANIGFYPSYEYIKKDGVYRRFYNRKDMIDGATGEAYEFSNVIVMYADYSWFDDAADRPIVALTGSNKCEYFIGGKHFTGSWVRNSVGESTAYLDDEGSEVLFKPGKTFIQIVKPDVKIELVK